MSASCDTCLEASLFVRLLPSNVVISVSEHRKTTCDFPDSPSEEVHISSVLCMCVPKPISIQVVRLNGQSSLISGLLSAVQRNINSGKTAIEGENCEFFCNLSSSSWGQIYKTRTQNPWMGKASQERPCQEQMLMSFMWTILYQRAEILIVAYTEEKIMSHVTEVWWLAVQTQCVPQSSGPFSQ